jgi:hypothetical protein
LISLVPDCRHSNTYARIIKIIDGQQTTFQYVATGESFFVNLSGKIVLILKNSSIFLHPLLSDNSSLKEGDWDFFRGRIRVRILSRRETDSPENNLSFFLADCRNGCNFVAPQYLKREFGLLRRGKTTKAKSSLNILKAHIQA